MEREIKRGNRLTERNLDHFDALLDVESRRSRSFNVPKNGKTLLNAAEALTQDAGLSSEQRMQAERIFKRLDYVNARRASSLAAAKGKPPLHRSITQSKKRRGGARRTLRNRA